MKAIDITQKFNVARMNLGNIRILDREDIEAILKASGFPKGSDMISQCIKFSIIEKKGNNKYMLPSKPIYYQKIGNAIDACRKQRNVAAARYRARIAAEIDYSQRFLSKHGFQVIGG
jgi:hypothetical protein